MLKGDICHGEGGIYGEWSLLAGTVRVLTGHRCTAGRGRIIASARYGIAAGRIVIVHLYLSFFVLRVCYPLLHTMYFFSVGYPSESIICEYRKIINGTYSISVAEKRRHLTICNIKFTFFTSN